jgi:hypothetical protein
MQPARCPFSIHHGENLTRIAARGDGVSVKMKRHPGRPGSRFCVAPYPTTSVAWMALPEAYAPASIALQHVRVLA